MKVTIQKIRVDRDEAPTTYWVEATGEDKTGPFNIIRFGVDPTVWDLMRGAAEMALDEAHLPGIPVDVD